MIRRLTLAAAVALALPAMAQPTPHAGHSITPAADPHAGHQMPATPPDPHAGHTMAAEPPTADPHAGHQMPATPPDPHAGHTMTPEPPAADPHAGHAMSGADLTVGNEPPPAVPADDLADALFGPAAMARARDTLRGEHGRVRFAKTMLDTFEVRPSAGGDAYAWGGAVRYGGDIHRFGLKSEGEGAFGGRLEHAEVQALYSRAIGPYFDLQAGVRQDLGPGPSPAYATVGVEGLAPYWFEVGAALFLSDAGDLSARLEGGYDLRLTQRLIVEPRVELNLAASAAPARRLGAGLTDAEIGLRLRYEFSRRFAPYVGVHHERKFGDTAVLARAIGDHAHDTRVVLGLRAWF
jgi:copper resistance protein B